MRPEFPQETHSFQYARLGIERFGQIRSVHLSRRNIREPSYTGQKDRRDAQIAVLHLNGYERLAALVILRFLSKADVRQIYMMARAGNGGFFIEVDFRPNRSSIRYREHNLITNCDVTGE